MAYTVTVFVHEELKVCFFSSSQHQSHFMDWGWSPWNVWSPKLLIVDNGFDIQILEQYKKFIESYQEIDNPDKSFCLKHLASLPKISLS